MHTEILTSATQHFRRDPLIIVRFVDINAFEFFDSTNPINAMELLDEILNEMEEDRPLRGTPSNSFGAGLMNHSGQQKAYNALKDWSGELSMVGESFDDFGEG